MNPLSNFRRSSKSCATLILAIAAGAAQGQSFDWPSLVKAHASALRTYAATASDKHYEARQPACRALMAAGADRAIGAPLGAVKPAEAAAILNDFGFLATPECAPWPLPAKAIRRAIELDPGRNVAHLNLADVLRNDLQRVVRGGEDTEARRAEIRREYQAYFAGGGKRTDEMGHWADPPLAVPAHADACHFILAHVEAGRVPELLSGGAERIKFGSRVANIKIRFEGTSLAPTVEAVDARTGDTIETLVEGGGRDDASVVGIAGAVYVVHWERGGQAVHVIPVGRSGGCDLQKDSTEHVSPESAEPALCRRLVAGDDGIEEIAFDEPPAVPAEVLEPRWQGSEVGPGEPQGSALVDVANDGHPVRLLLMKGSLRQPDLCPVQLHELLQPDGRGLVDEAERRELAKRGIEADDPGHIDADCYGETHYLLDGRRTLAETLEHGDAGAAPWNRSVRVNEHGQWRALCNTKSDDHWSIVGATPAVK